MENNQSGARIHARSVSAWRTLSTMLGAFGLLCAMTNAANANSFTIAPNLLGGFGNYKWNISADGAAAAGNPTLTLIVGQTYTFTVNTAPSHPFYIKLARSIGPANAYPTSAASGLDHNGVTSSATIMTFTVPASAKGTLYYNCGVHGEMTGTILVVDVPDPIFANDFELPPVI